MSLPLREALQRDEGHLRARAKALPSEITYSSVADYLSIEGRRVPRYTKEFWSPAQRQGSSIHEVSYRACFKPQLPQFFIQLFSKPHDTVYDPFMGRGTTIVEAALLNRRIIGNDINPLCSILSEPRLCPPTEDEVLERLQKIEIDNRATSDIDLSMFYHKQTEAEIVSLKNYLRRRKHHGAEDHTDRWIKMVATTRLTGHSPGFFSVYSLPPNQAVTPDDQRRINRLRKQRPTYRDVKRLIMRKTSRMLRDLAPEDIRALKRAGETGKFLARDAGQTAEIRDNCVQLVVTSPPFLNIVDYATDNWLRCWFNGIETEDLSSKITMVANLQEWRDTMKAVLVELHRVCKKGAVIAFEVGEMANGRIRLDEHIAPLGVGAGLDCLAVLVNEQCFTKTSNIWGVHNNRKGTNTNRIVLFQKS